MPLRAGDALVWVSGALGVILLAIGAVLHHLSRPWEADDAAPKGRVSTVRLERRMADLEKR